ncbi:WD domain, G-beta repeat containing protein [Babesia divergens]|uniref:Coronin n=1 Tax=Babesia divergens TaxID=32595 RepID=A0AAD9G6V0_BABDI|nr:WD domain, G-beta repeat containing protein [Babesia divergens]
MTTVRLKNVFGEPFKQAYYDLNLTAKPTVFSGGMAASNTHIAFPWEVGGGGLITLIDMAKLGRNSGNGRLSLRGHTGSIQDISFNDFNYNVLASASDDCSVKVWHVPSENDGTFTSNLTGHTKKTTNVVWNSATDFVLMSGSLDNTVRVWNVEKEAQVLCVPVDGQYSYCSWSYDGETMLVATKEGMAALVDPREGKTSSSFRAHESHKATSAIWLGGNYGNDTIATTGYVGNHTRQIRVWDSRNVSQPLVSKDIDSSPGPLIPYWDDATGLLTVAGKGDLTVRIFQYLDSDLNRAGEFKCSGTIKMFCYVPHTACDKSKCELSRMLYNTNCKEINPISIVVMRRNSEVAMGEIYGSLRPRRRSLANDWQSSNLTGTLESTVSSLPRALSTVSPPEQVLVKDMTPTGKSFNDIFTAAGSMNIKYRPSFTDVAMINDLEDLKRDVENLISSLKEMHNISAPVKGSTGVSVSSSFSVDTIRECGTRSMTSEGLRSSGAMAGSFNRTNHSESSVDMETPTEVAAVPESQAAGGCDADKEDPPVEVRSNLSGVKAAIAAMEARAQAHASKQASLTKH